MPDHLLQGHVLLDNGTVRSALVALGLMSPTDQDASIKVFDAHVACAELLIESLVLHEAVFVPPIHEDYPPALRLLQGIVGADLVRPLPLAEADMQLVEGFALDEFNSWPFATEPILKRIKQFAGVDAPQTRWNRWDATILREYREQPMYQWHERIRAVTDSAIRVLDGADSDEVDQQAKRLGKSTHAPGGAAMDRAVLWLTYRTCLYDCIGWALDIPYAPHPQRAAIWKAVNLRRLAPVAFRNVPVDVLLDARLTVGDSLNRALGWRKYNLEIPPFFAFVLSKAKTPADVLPLVLSLRDERGAKALRGSLVELTRATRNGASPKKTYHLLGQFSRLTRDLVRDYALPTPTTPKPSVQVTAIPGVSFNVSPPPALERLASNLSGVSRPHLAFLRNVFDVTSRIWQMGEMYDKLYRGSRSLAAHSISDPVYDSSVFGNHSTPVAMLDQNLIAPSSLRSMLADEMRRPDGGALHLVLVDIDGLDMLNRSSRRLGDVALAMVGAAVMAAGVAAMTKVGGDTFMAITRGDVEPWATELRARIAGRRVLGGKRVVESVAVSIGAATAGIDGASQDDVFEVAYRRLQAEKSQKRARAPRQ